MTLLPCLSSYSASVPSAYVTCKYADMADDPSRGPAALPSALRARRSAVAVTNPQVGIAEREDGEGKGWAADEEGITGDALLDFVNNTLLPKLSPLTVTDPSPLCGAFSITLDPTGASKENTPARPGSYVHTVPPVPVIAPTVTSTYPLYP